MSLFASNVGTLDAIIRMVLGVGILVGMVALLRTSDSDWALTILIHPGIIAAYLIMTAVARNDIVYHFAGWSTRKSAGPRERYRMRLSPPPLR